MKYFFLFIILIFLFIMCSNPQPTNNPSSNNKIFYIDVESNINNRKEIPLSEVTDGISYIPLETNEKSFVKEIAQVVITESYIFMHDWEKLLQFTRDGKFVRQIGRKGRGPGEYISIIRVLANEKANIILMQGELGLFQYDFTGKFIGKGKGNLSNTSLFIDTSHIALYSSNNTNKPTNLVILNKAMDTIKSFVNYDPPKPSNEHRTGAPLYVFDKKLFFKENFNDTVFGLEDTMLVPHIIYNEKQLLFDKNFHIKSTNNIENLLKEVDQVKDKLRTSKILEDNSFVFTSYRRGINPYENKFTRVLFNKGNEEVSIVGDEGFVNDLDCGKNFWPMEICFDSLTVGYIQPYELKALVASDEFKTSTPKYPEKKKELEKLANSLDENDNPILMLVKLKE